MLSQTYFRLRDDACMHWYAPHMEYTRWPLHLFSAMYTATSQIIFSGLSTSFRVALWEIVSVP